MTSHDVWSILSTQLARPYNTEWVEMNRNISTMSKVRATNGNGNDLIVGFGHRHRRQTAESDTGTCGGGGGKVTATATNTIAIAMTMERQVSFSEDVIVHCFQYPPTDEVSKRWNSKRDKYFFEQEMARDVQSIRDLLSITPMENHEKEVLYDCVGLEALMSSKVTRFLKEKKRRHARSIVEMQYSLSEEKLAAYAASHSSQSRERAQKLAAGYSEILP